MSAEIAPDEGPSFPDERQERIAELIATRGKVRIAQLTELFGVSEPTVRKASQTWSSGAFSSAPMAVL